MPINSTTPLIAHFDTRKSALPRLLEEAKTARNPSQIIDNFIFDSRKGSVIFTGEEVALVVRNFKQAKQLFEDAGLIPTLFNKLFSKKIPSPSEQDLKEVFNKLALAAATKTMMSSTKFITGTEDEFEEINPTQIDLDNGNDEYGADLTRIKENK